MPKFLLLRFSSIGDIVLTTPVIRCIKQQVPNAEVHFLTKRPFGTVLKNNPYIDKLLLFDTSTAEIRDMLKAEGYDAIIDLHHNRRTFFLKQSLRRPHFSFRKLNIEKWLRVNIRIDRLPSLHIVDRYMATVSSFGVTNDGNGLDHFITNNDRQIIHQLPISHTGEFVAIVIGAQHATKRLPLDKLVNVCQLVKQPIVLIGGKEDYQTGELIQRAIGNKVINWCGKCSINESAAVLEKAERVITHDTGMMHIAAALKRPIVSVWGNTIPKFGMTPYYGNVKIPNRIIEVNGLSCRPCSKIGFDTCPKGHFNCMHQQDATAIAAEV